MSKKQNSILNPPKTTLAKLSPERLAELEKLMRCEHCDAPLIRGESFWVCSRQLHGKAIPPSVLLDRQDNETRQENETQGCLMRAPAQDETRSETVPGKDAA